MQIYYKPDLFENIELDSQELCHGVFLYKNALKNNEQVLELVKLLEHMDIGSLLTPGWGPWGGYGKTTYFYTPLEYSSIENIFNSIFYGNEASILNNHALCAKTLFEVMVNTILKELKQKIIHDYLNKNSFKIPDKSFFTRIDLCKYEFQQESLANDLEMAFHNDYVTADHHLSCDKFLVSCNSYLSGNFEGAEIIFYSNGKMIEYKPCAGDVIVFPSGNPNYVTNKYCLHAVKRGSGTRYISRYFLKYHDDRDNLTKIEDLINDEDKSVSKAYWDKRSFFGMVPLEEINKHARGEIDEFQFEKYYNGGVF